MTSHLYTCIACVGEDLVSESPLQAEEVETRKRRVLSVSTTCGCASSSAWRSALPRSDLPQRRAVPSAAVHPLGCRVPATVCYFRSRGSRWGTGRRVASSPAAVCWRNVESSPSNVADRSRLDGVVPSNRTVQFELSSRKQRRRCLVARLRTWCDVTRCVI